MPRTAKPVRTASGQCKGCCRMRASGRAADAQGREVYPRCVGALCQSNETGLTVEDHRKTRLSPTEKRIADPPILSSSAENGSATALQGGS